MFKETVHQKWKFIVYSASCDDFLLLDTKVDILENVGVQTTLNPIDFCCMNENKREIDTMNVKK